MSESTKFNSTAENLRNKANMANQAKDLEICNAILVEIEAAASLGKFLYRIPNGYFNQITDKDFLKTFFVSSPHFFQCDLCRDSSDNTPCAWISWKK